MTSSWSHCKWVKLSSTYRVNYPLHLHISYCRFFIQKTKYTSNISSFVYEHYDVISWEHFPRYWPFVRGIQRSPVNSPRKGQWRGALMFFLICVWINGWVNNRKAGDLRRHRAHYGVTVMNSWHNRWTLQAINIANGRPFIQPIISIYAAAAFSPFCAIHTRKLPVWLLDSVRCSHHYSDGIVDAIASHITGVSVVC